ncbi:MAG: hypothetical protein MJ252_18300, partial [archaeon]|nr:hypothetical protein [archaeon]
LNIFKESENGILLYLDGKLIKRCDQGILGETSFFYKKHFKRENKPSIGWFGFIELPKSLFEIIGNKAEFKDMSMFSYFYGKLHGMLKKAIPKNN